MLKDIVNKYGQPIHGPRFGRLSSVEISEEMDSIYISLGIDLGTTGTKLSCYNAKNRTLTNFSATNHAYVPSPFKKDCQVMNIGFVANSFASTVNQLRSDFGDGVQLVINKVAFANQMHGIVCWNSKQPTKPSPLLTWEDTHVPDSLLFRINQKLSSRSNASTYSPVFRGFGIASLLYLLEEHAEMFDEEGEHAYDRCGTVGSYFSWLLTHSHNGNTTDASSNPSYLHASDACAWGCYSLEHGWAIDVLNELHPKIVPMLPKVLNGVQSVGNLHCLASITSTAHDGTRNVEFQAALESNIRGIIDVFSQFSIPVEGCPVFVPIGDHTSCMVTIRDYFLSSNALYPDGTSDETSQTTGRQLCVVNIGTSAQAAVLPLSSHQDQSLLLSSTSNASPDNGYVEIRPFPIISKAKNSNEAVNGMGTMVVGAGMNGGNMLQSLASQIQQAFCDNWRIHGRELPHDLVTFVSSGSSEQSGNMDTKLLSLMQSLSNEQGIETLNTVHAMMDIVCTSLCDTEKRDGFVASIVAGLRGRNLQITSSTLEQQASNSNGVSPHKRSSAGAAQGLLDLQALLPPFHPERSPIGYGASDSDHPDTTRVNRRTDGSEDKKGQEIVGNATEEAGENGANTAVPTLQTLVDAVFSSNRVRNDQMEPSAPVESDATRIQNWILLCKLFGILYFECTAKIASRLMSLVPQTVFSAVDTVVPLGGALQKNPALLLHVIRDVENAKKSAINSSAIAASDYSSSHKSVQLFDVSESIMAYAGAMGSLIASGQKLFQ